VEGAGADPSERPTEQVVRHEEEAHVDPAWRGIGTVEAHRVVESDDVRLSVPREVERVTHERIPAHENDSGQIETLPDGTVSIPLYEEEVVVTKRVVLRERVLIRKQTVTEHHDVRERVRRERVTIDDDAAPRGSVRGVDGFLGGASRAHPGSPVETRPFFLTSEFLALVAAVVGIVLTAALSNVLDAPRAWILLVAVLATYMASRGFAKRGGDW
jgi:uncharacterized protein (TIGR02271 family)